MLSASAKLLMSNKDYSGPSLGSGCGRKREGGKPLDPDDLSVAFFTDHRPQRLRLAGLRGSRRELAFQQLAREGNVDAEGPGPGNRRITDDRAQLDPLG
jgi:hypothetical protein